ncbi:MAG TPA: class I SAM-dependent methyltransferase [Granulicella sp.]
MAQYAERFTGRVTEYERYRLRYPQAMMTLLHERCGLTPSDRIADVGAGTGMLSESFLENGNAVIAIEPNEEMRAVCEELRAQYPQLTVVDASAETTGLADASVEFVTAGRAFHWFDAPRALAEFKRILKPQGWVVLAANGRSKGAAPHELEYEQIMAEHGVDYPGVKSRYEAHEAAIAAFVPETVVRERLQGEQELTLEEFIGQVQSYSWAPLPGHPKHEGMQQALREYFAKWQKEGVVRLGTTCYVNCGQLA